MSKKLIVGLGFLSILIITTGFSCSRTPLNGVTKAVNINAGCLASDPSFTIDRKDQVSWTANGQDSDTVSFNYSEGSPFNQPTYSIPQGQTKNSGPVRKDAAAGKYRYTVAGTPSGCSVDPVVIIHP